MGALLRQLEVRPASEQFDHDLVEAAALLGGEVGEVGMERRADAEVRVPAVGLLVHDADGSAFGSKSVVVYALPNKQGSRCYQHPALYSRRYIR